ncbi:Nn.00g102240.m01.CDS01 [Neocucurbitaria sp. VM-36]
MSQAEAPRVYKFVGAFSRKRRRRNVTIGSTAANGRAAVNSPLQVKSPVMPTVPASSFEPVNGEDIDRLTDHSYMPSTQRVSEVHAIPPVTSTNCEVTEENTQPSIEGFYQVQDPNWSCPSLWNPFFDLELPILRPFHHIDGHHQLSVDLSVDGTPTQLLDDSPISNAPQSQDSGDPALHLAEEAGFQPSLPSLGLQGATCDISLTISQLLTRYDQEFCIMPLTHDFEANPFRVDTKTGRGSQLLLHCILALSYKHINRDTGSYANEARTHKRKALQMLRELESVSQSASLEVALLDAVLILMTLDCATSAHGPWTWYLKRAHKMIEAADFASIRKTPRMEACIEILIW